MIREAEQNTAGVSNWDRLCQQFNLTLEKSELPQVKAKWLKDDWRKFAQITQNPDNELRQILLAFLANKTK